MTDKLFGTALFCLMMMLPIGELYWLWTSIQIGSFWMFVFGLAGPLILIAAPVGAYGLLFGMPQWVFHFFG
mgnify:CR=1 FL=1